MSTQILGGYLAQIYGGKWVVGASNLGCGLVSLALPAVARIDPGSAWPVFSMRVLEGALQAPIWPGTYSLVGKWIPAAEKPGLMACVSSGEAKEGQHSVEMEFGHPTGACAGAYLGLVCGNLVSGALASAFGWEIVFYVLGGLLVVWFCLWGALVFNEPGLHPRATTAERDYIEATSEAGAAKTSLPPMPLGRVVKSVPVWALQGALIGFYWVIYTIVTLSPLYLDTVYNLPVDLVRMRGTFKQG